MSIHRRRLGLYIPWALFIAACIGWTVYWFAARDAAIRGLDRAIAAAGARGVEVRHGGVRGTGYPLHLTLVLKDVSITPPAPFPAVTAATLPVSVHLTDPRHLIVDLKNGATLTRDGRSAVIQPRGGALSLRWTDERFARASMRLDLRSGGGVLIHLRPDVRDASALQLAIEARRARETAADGVRIGLVLDHGRLLLDDGAAAWRAAGGVARIEAMDVRAAGLVATGVGAFRLDQSWNLTGDVALTGADLSALDALLSARFRIAPCADAACRAKLVLRAADGAWRYRTGALAAGPFYDPLPVGPLPDGSAPD